MTYDSDNHSYPIPESDESNWDVPLQRVLEEMDADIIIKNTKANRPSSPPDDTWFLATDEKKIYHYDGSWSEVAGLGVPGTPLSVILYAQGYANDQRGDPTTSELNSGQNMVFNSDGSGTGSAGDLVYAVNDAGTINTLILAQVSNAT